jgi:hypothetical protein
VLDPTRRWRVNGITTDDYVVTVMWSVSDVQNVNISGARFAVEVPLREAARTCASC